jgi:hypothetical protein
MGVSKRFTWIALAVVVVVVVTAIVLMFAFGFIALTPSPSSTPTSEPKTYLNLTIDYNSTTGIGNYTTPFISIVAHTLVVVTITNHDPTASPLFVPRDNHVLGTVGGNETLTGCQNATGSVAVLASNGISHTFTVLDPHYNISVPIPPAQSVSMPCVVAFELSMNYSELTSWGCVANCDNGVMAAGDMWGELLVEA